MLLSNLEFIPGKRVEKHLGLVHGSSVRAKHVGRDIMASLKNIVGGELKGYTELMRESRDEAIARMVKEAKSVGVGMDYFKRFLARLRNLVGGHVGSYETLLDRARREALLRMKEAAKALDAGCVFNVKYSTANIMSGDRRNKGSGCVEVIVYGTAIITRRAGSGKLQQSSRRGRHQ